MPGFLLTIGAEKFINKTDNDENLVVETIENKNFVVQRRTIRKFLEDKLFVDTDKYLIVIEGVVFNRTDLIKQYATDGTFVDCVVNMYHKKGDPFFNLFRGSFSGVFYDKDKDKWLIYTGHIGDKQVFCSKLLGMYVFASEIGYIIELMKECGEKISFDETGIYLALTYGCVIENYTLIKGIEKLSPGHYYEISSNGMREVEYHRFNNIPVEMTLEDAIEGVDKLFRQAVRREFDKDIEYGYKHIVTLSGGLDSRMTSWVAHEMGYKKQLNITFAESNSCDFTTAQQIAKDLKHDFIFKFLDNGNCIYDIDDVSKITYGTSLFFSLSHGKSLYDNINHVPYGIFHTGQIGDSILGTFFTSMEYNENYYLGQSAISTELIDRMENFKFNQNYKNFEIYSLYIRGFQRALQGNLSIQEYSEVGSPFCDVDFLEFAYSIPLVLRYNHKIYFDWVLKKYPEAANYLWNGRKKIEHINNNPISVSGVSKGGKILRYRSQIGRIIRYVKERCVVAKELGKKTESSTMIVNNGMNPVDYWYCTNNELREFICSYYSENIDLLKSPGMGISKKLITDMEYLYSREPLLDKLLVLSVLSAIRLSLVNN